MSCVPHIQLQFQPDLEITHMYSGEGEEVRLSVPVRPTGNVEDWLCDVEKSMKLSLRDNIERSLKAYPEVRPSMTGWGSCYFSTVNHSYEPCIELNLHLLSVTVPVFCPDSITLI